MESHEDLFLRLQGIFESSIDAIITIDAFGIIEMVNEATCKLFLYEQEELLGQNIKILMPTPYHDNHDQYLDNYHKTRKPKIIGIGREVIGRQKNGRTFPCRLAVSEVVLNDRIIFTGIIHDLSEIVNARNKIVEFNNELREKVTDRTSKLEDTINKLLNSNLELENEISIRKETEKLLKSSQQELEVALNKEKELGTLKTRFVSMASHEFRTPLATILSSASLISKYETTDQQEQRLKHVARIKDSVTNLTGILNDFLSLSRLEEGKIEANISALNYLELSQNIQNELLGIVKEGQTINSVFHGTESEIFSDPRILKNIMFNLLSNAIKYSDKEIFCDFFVKEDQYVIIIKDSGIGIPDYDQKYMFDRFFRAENAVNIQGTGLGLNIVKRYVDLLNGSISFKSELNKGTEFTVILPKFAPKISL
jgi:two-component system, LuxR family, sensor kinase FixL